MAQGLVWLAALLLGLLHSGPALARDVTFNDGPALGLALGSDGAGLGGFAAYYIAWPEQRLAITPHGGVGIPVVGMEVVPWSLGILGSYGRRHRLVVDLHLKATDEQALELYGEEIDGERIFGVGLAVGWEWLSPSGFFVRANLGPAFLFLPPIYQPSESWTVTGNALSVGAKLW